MSTSRSRKLALAGIAAAAFAAAALLATAQVAQGVSGELAVESAAIAPGDQDTVDVTANVPSPGLGAWTVDVIVANPDQVSIVSCDVPSHSVCNADYSDSPPTVRFAGATAMGIIGETSLGTITFECADSEGSSVLNLSTAGFADATLGGPVEIAATHSPGTITCSQSAAGGPTATPSDGGGGPGGGTATPPAGGLPVTGSGASGGSVWLATAMVALIGLGLTALVTYVIVYVRERYT